MGGLGEPNDVVLVLGVGDVAVDRDQDRHANGLAARLAALGLALDGYVLSDGDEGQAVVLEDGGHAIAP
jgi:hypothetical protein